MSLMKRLRVTINADAVAKGVLAMMRERHAATGDSEDNEDLIRLGMLPKRWMEMIESQMMTVICDRFQVNQYEVRRGEVTTIVKTGDGDDELDVMTFSLKELVREMVHEVSLALYANVEMLV